VLAKESYLANAEYYCKWSKSKEASLNNVKTTMFKLALKYFSKYYITTF